MTQNGKKTKDKMAHLNMNILSLRVRRIPRKLACCIVPEIFIFALVAYRLGVAAVAWFISAQLLIWISFIVISAITRPARRRYMENNSRKYQKSKSDAYQNNSANTGSAHSEYRSNSRQEENSKQESGSKQESNSHQQSNSQQNNSQQQSNGRQQYSRQYRGMSVAEALKLFGLKSSFTDGELRKAYYREAKKYHPDQNLNKANAEEYKDMMCKINQARDLLSRMCTK